VALRIAVDLFDFRFSYLIGKNTTQGTTFGMHLKHGACSTLTPHAKKVFETPVGRFSYRPIPLDVYALGVDWLYDDINGGRFIATAEKALCDKIRGDRGVGRLTQEKMRDYLLYDLRIEWEVLLGLDVELIEEIAKKYKSYNLKSLSGLLKRKIRCKKQHL